MLLPRETPARLCPFVPGRQGILRPGSPSQAFEARRSRGDFAPTDVPDCSLWLRSDLGITLNGSDISAWADQSGQGHDPSQATASAQPEYVTGVVNGHAVARYAGAQELLFDASDYPQASSFTAYAVINLSAAANVGWRVIMNRSLGTAPALYFGTSGTTGTGQPSIFWNANRVSLGSDIRGAWHLVRWRYVAGSVVGVRVDDGVEVTAAIADTGLSDWFNVGQDNAQQMTGDLAELAAYDASIASGAASDVSLKSYFNARYVIW